MESIGRADNFAADSFVVVDSFVVGSDGVLAVAAHSRMTYGEVIPLETRKHFGCFSAMAMAFYERKFVD